MGTDNELEALREEVEMYKRLVKNTAMHLRGFKELDSELSEFCSYADDIDDAYYTDADGGEHPTITADDLTNDEDEED